MPEIRITLDVDGRLEILTEYFCDWPDCPNHAVEVVGMSRDSSARTVMCRVHAAELAKIKSRGSSH
ncbi:MAG TPA: hypothetical protein VLT86_18895 [Vicinamibacterales bacterium]|nr:hypothetical protein [Vicinamibacterales bacterium]